MSENLEKSKAIELEHLNKFLVTKVDKVTMYDSDTYEECGQLQITLLKTETREANEIISINAC